MKKFILFVAFCCIAVLGSTQHSATAECSNYISKRDAFFADNWAKRLYCLDDVVQIVGFGMQTYPKCNDALLDGIASDQGLQGRIYMLPWGSNGYSSCSNRATPTGKDAICVVIPVAQNLVDQGAIYVDVTMTEDMVLTNLKYKEIAVGYTHEGAPANNIAYYRGHRVFVNGVQKFESFGLTTNVRSSQVGSYGYWSDRNEKINVKVSSGDKVQIRLYFYGQLSTGKSVHEIDEVSLHGAKITGSTTQHIEASSTGCGILFIQKIKCGNVVWETNTFEVVDFEKPFFTKDPQSGSGSEDDFKKWVTNRAGAQAHDACQGAVPVEMDYKIPTGPGVVDAFVFAKDGCGNTSVTKNTSFTIVSTTICNYFCKSDFTVNLGGNVCEARVGAAQMVTFDNCQGYSWKISKTQSGMPVSEVFFDKAGTYPVWIWTFKDGVLQGSCESKIIVTGSCCEAFVKNSFTYTLTECTQELPANYLVTTSNGCSYQVFISRDGLNSGGSITVTHNDIGKTIPVSVKILGPNNLLIQGTTQVTVVGAGGLYCGPPPCNPVLSCSEHGARFVTLDNPYWYLSQKDANQFADFIAKNYAINVGCGQLVQDAPQRFVSPDGEVTLSVTFRMKSTNGADQVCSYAWTFQKEAPVCVSTIVSTDVLAPLSEIKVHSCNPESFLANIDFSSQHWVDKWRDYTLTNARAIPSIGEWVKWMRKFDDPRIRFVEIDRQTNACGGIRVTGRWEAYDCGKVFFTSVQDILVGDFEAPTLKALPKLVFSVTCPKDSVSIDLAPEGYDQCGPVTYLVKTGWGATKLWSYAPAGKWWYKITAVDCSGNQSIQREGWIEVKVSGGGGTATIYDPACVELGLWGGVQYLWFNANWCLQSYFYDCFDQGKPKLYFRINGKLEEWYRFERKDVGVRYLNIVVVSPKGETLLDVIARFDVHENSPTYSCLSGKSLDGRSSGIGAVVFNAGTKKEILVKESGKITDEIMDYKEERLPSTSVISSVDVYPNPARDITTIEITVPTEMSVGVEIYDLSGRRMRSEAEILSQGTHDIKVPVMDMPNGMYTIRITGGDKVIAKKLVIQKE